ncbi:hypothetical protein R1flu_006858 [Riccia fluitans]|uniref:Uncharacterized protein n=1 Tax=Riccia fluitans TaxID=41844 RepID=A0ABD1YZY0_9MARC
MLNAIFAPIIRLRLEHFQHNLLAFYHYAWEAITNPTAPIPDWGDAIEKTMSRQIKALGVCKEATCIGLYLAHLYKHFHEIDAEEKEDSKKRKALIQTIFDSDPKPRQRMRRNQRRRFLTHFVKAKPAEVNRST